MALDGAGGEVRPQFCFLLFFFWGGGGCETLSDLRGFAFMRISGLVNVSSASSALSSLFRVSIYRALISFQKSKHGQFWVSL